ncbi:AT-hook motif nuclear-localized protein 1-like [Eucalyptus grandis]|uniref:AT-hook motif nuclear-localized protein 1-like n=1 Tax=Eucalyptus grandis TaxID=71139 RepID=UPI00192EB220|nr:AT-hook motif nuclear-localized protein 1-like [Eucalyptus grandis]
MVINPSQFVRKSNPFAKCGRIGYQGEIFRKVMEYSNRYPPKKEGSRGPKRVQGDWVPASLELWSGREEGDRGNLFCEVGGPAMEFAGNFDVQIVTIHRGEEILAKLSDLIEPGTRSISILSAARSVSSAVVCQLGPPAGLLTYEGCFEILAQSGSFTIWEGRICTRPEVSLVSVMLTRPDGQVFGGGVAGPLTAAGPTQIVVATFKNVVHNEPIRVDSTNPHSRAAIGISANPIHEVRQPEQIARMAEVDDNSGTPTSVLLEPTDKEAKTITSGNNDVNPASLRIDEHYPLGLVERMLDRNMPTDTNANVPEL